MRKLRCLLKVGRLEVERDEHDISGVNSSPRFRVEKESYELGEHLFLFHLCVLEV